MSKKTKRLTSDALAIIDRLLYDGKSDQQALVSQERTNAAVARRIHDLRTQAGLSQRALAAQVGTTASVICRLEHADYDGHSLAILQRIAAVLNQRVEVKFVSVASGFTTPKGRPRRRAPSKVKRSSGPKHPHPHRPAPM